MKFYFTWSDCISLMPSDAGHLFMRLADVHRPFVHRLFTHFAQFLLGLCIRVTDSLTDLHHQE